MKRSFIVTALCFTFALGAQGQYNYSLNYQTNVISGLISNWAGNGTYIVGSNTFLNALLIINGGVLSNGYGEIGLVIGGSNNVAIVRGTGSVWSNQVNLLIGHDGAGNQLVVSNGGAVFDVAGFLGFNISSSNNVALVTGTGSVWSNQGDLVFGESGAAGNRLVVSNGGVVFNATGDLGFQTASSHNVALVTGTGSVWNNSGNLLVGDTGAGNQLVVSNGGAVFCNFGRIGASSPSSSNNVAVVTGTGSVWSNQGNLLVGDTGGGCQLVVSNGGAVFNAAGFVGYLNSSNVAVVMGAGARWENRAELYVGYNANTNILNIGAGGSVIASNVYVGFVTGAGNKINVTGGSLSVTNAPGTGTLDIERGTLTFNGGTATVDMFTATNGANSLVTFSGGTLHTKGSAVANSQQFVVGDGVSAANFHLLGGVHSFNNGLRVRNNSTLSGCGTINGVVVVDAGGTVLADCSPLVFGQSVTNNGIMRAENGSVLEAYGPVVNNGLIDIIGGSTNFHSTFINNGTVADASMFRIVNIIRETNNVRVVWSSVSGRSNIVQVSAGSAGGSYSNNFTDLNPAILIPGAAVSVTNYLDVGAATNSPARYYRVRLVP